MDYGEKLDQWMRMKRGLSKEDAMLNERCCEKDGALGLEKVGEMVRNQAATVRALPQMSTLPVRPTPKPLSRELEVASRLMAGMMPDLMDKCRDDVPAGHWDSRYDWYLFAATDMAEALIAEHDRRAAGNRDETT